jgi:hypothetical protein
MVSLTVLAFQILERFETHEVGMVDDERFGAALDEVPFGGVGGDDV